MNSIPNLKHVSKISNSSLNTSRGVSKVKDRSEAKWFGPNQRDDKIFSEGGHRKRNPKVIVHIINHIIRGKGVYKTLNSISKKGFHGLAHIVTQLRLNDVWVTQIFDLFPIREEIISRKMTICSLYGRFLYSSHRLTASPLIASPPPYCIGFSSWYRDAVRRWVGKSMIQNPWLGTDPGKNRYQKW